MNNKSLTRFAWLAIGGTIVTIALETAAYFLTGSVVLLSDALESVVNLVAAVITFVALTIALKLILSRLAESDRGPQLYESCALPTELRRQQRSS